MAITAFKRYEMKFVLTEEQYQALLPQITARMNADEYCRNGKSYNIYNIYYDTMDSSLIRNSLLKPDYKEKLRLRSYSIPTSSASKVFLELKKKTGGIVHKRRAAMTLREAYDFVEAGKKPVVENYMGKQIINELDYFLSRNKVTPAAYISYTRSAFFGKQDTNFRITFDHDITTRRKDLFLENGSYGEELLEKGQHLMEVKISTAVPLWLSQTLSNLKIYKTSFSKYGCEYKKYTCQNSVRTLNMNYKRRNENVGINLCNI